MSAEDFLAFSKNLPSLQTHETTRGRNQQRQWSQQPQWNRNRMQNDQSLQFLPANFSNSTNQRFQGSNCFRGKPYNTQKRSGLGYEHQRHQNQPSSRSNTGKVCEKCVFYVQYFAISEDRD